MSLVSEAGKVPDVDLVDVQGRTIVDLVMLGGNVLTMDGRNGRAEAVAVQGGKITAVGSSAEVSQMAGERTRVVHLAGRTVVPGFLDPHNHFSMTTFEPVSVDCRMPPLETVKSVLDAIAATAKDTLRGQWIWGLGYNSINRGEHRRLTRWELDEAAPDNPVCIMDFSYHSCYANSAALKLAGVDRDTPDPHRGWILRDDKGEPNGTLWERAMDLVHRLSIRAHVDHYGEDGIADLVYRNAMRHLSHGITSIGDAVVMPESAEMYRMADKQKKLPIMVHQMRGGDGFFSPPEKASQGGFPDDNVSDRLRGNIMKLFMDPVFPAWGMVKHYAHGHQERMGVVYYTQEEVDALVLAAAGRGIQVAIHCIGNWAIEQGLNTFERAMRENPASELRFRIEHFSIPTLEQISRAASLGVIVSHQPAFLYTIGEHLHGSADYMGIDAPDFPIRTMLEAGVPLAAGSDFPCAPVSPLLGLYAMVSRTKEVDGVKLAPDEAIVPMDGLKMYTMGSAFAMFRDHEVGSIETGKRADMVVLSHDPTVVAKEFIREIVVQQTYVDGELLFERI